MAAAEKITSPTREDLARLLAAKDEAQRAFSAACQATREGAGKTLDERIALDIAEREALQASCAADHDYDDALTAYLAGQQVAA